MSAARSASASVIVAAGCALLFSAASAPAVSTQSAPKVDFGRDVQPILQQHCVGCHGPSQRSDYRLDRRRAALAGPVRPLIIPGSSESSRLIRRLTGSEFGSQMPPTGPLAPRDIDILKTWIDQGAEWPDALANDVPPPAPDPGAVRLSDAIRSGDKAAVDTALTRDPQRINARGRAGTTPLMSAAVYANAELLTRMLDAQGNPNLGNDAGATALMWATDDVARTLTLLEHGADPNARSANGRTPLLLAAGQLDSDRLVQVLLDHGAVVTPGALAAAAARGNVEVVRRLLAAGARDTAAAAAATAALRAHCIECIDAILAVQPLPPLRDGLLGLFPPAGGRIDAVSTALRLGADANAKDAQSRTVLMKAVLADQIPPDVVRLLLDHGADVTVKTADGFTALDYARQVGNPAVVDTLMQAGAAGLHRDAPAPTAFVTNNSRSAAVQRSLPLLQKSAVEFYRKSGCLSCHSNSLTAMTVAAARAAKFSVDGPLWNTEVDTVSADVASGYDAMMQGLVPFGGGPPSVGYVLLGMAAQQHAKDFTTDAMVRLLRLSQLPDGHWSGANRPPFEASEFTYTAVNLRGILQFQSPRCTGCAVAIERAVAWLSRSRPATTEDRVFRVLGLAWGHAATPVLKSAVDDLLATQQSDGGWTQLPSLQSDAYATGEALVALHEAGASVTSAAYRRGIQFLLRTQLQDGSWFVRTRAHPTQPYFESGFPHRVNQYISTAATNWATLALIAAR